MSLRDVFRRHGIDPVTGSPLERREMPYSHPRHPWCQSGDMPDRQFMLRFADPDMRTMYWSGPDAEADAWEAWDRFAPAWSCTLLATLAQSDRPPCVSLSEQDRSTTGSTTQTVAPGPGSPPNLLPTPPCVEKG
jgi:hypothetical protein